MVIRRTIKISFVTKIELKDRDLAREIGNFLNIQNYSPLKSVDDHEELIGFNETDKIINNLEIKKAPGTDQINNKLIKCIKPGLIKFLQVFFICASN